MQSITTPSNPGSPLRRYLVVTALATPTNLIILVVLLAATSLPPLVCNLIAATLVTVPSFVACKSWVWRADGGAPRQAVTFWMSSLFNVAAASTVIWILEARGAPAPLVAVTPLVVYTVLWMVRFLFLDRLVFRRPATV